MKYRLSPRMMFASAGVLILAGGLVAGLPQAIGAKSSDLFRTRTANAGLKLDHVMVAGLERLAPAEIAAKLAIAQGTPLVAIDVAAARQRLLTLEWVGEAQVRRTEPDGLLVAITERKAAFVWQSRKKFYAVDSAGHVIAAIERREFLDLPHVVGEGAAEAAPALYSVLEQWPRLHAATLAAQYVGGRRWNLHFDNHVVIELPDHGLDEALRAVEDMIERGGLLKRGIKVVDVREPLRPRLELTPDAAEALFSPGQDT